MKTRKRKCNRGSRKESTDHVSDKEVLEDAPSDAICNKKMKNIAGDSVELDQETKEAKDIRTDDPTTDAAESVAVTPADDETVESSNHEVNNGDVNNNNTEAVNEVLDLTDEAITPSVTDRTLQNNTNTDSQMVTIVDCQYKSEDRPTSNHEIENNFKEIDFVTNDDETQLNKESNSSGTVEDYIEKEMGDNPNSLFTDIVCENMETDIGECADRESLLTANTQKVFTDEEYKQEEPDSIEDNAVDEMSKAIEDNSKVTSSMACLFNETNSDSITDNKDSSIDVVEQTISPSATDYKPDLVGRDEEGGKIGPGNSEVGDMNTTDEANIPLESVEINLASVSMHEDIAETKIEKIVNICETNIEGTNGQAVAAVAHDDQLLSQTSPKNEPNESTDKGRPTDASASDTEMIIMGTNILTESEQTVSEQEKETALENTDITNISASKDCEGEVSLDGVDDITDSQLCALDETMQPVSNSFQIPPNPVASTKTTSSTEQRGTRPDMEDGSAIMAGLIKEASYLNKMLMQTVRDMEIAKRK